MAQVMMDHNGSGCFGTRLASKAEARFRAEQPYKSHHLLFARGSRLELMSLSPREWELL